MSKNLKENKPRVVKSGEMMQGICSQWFIDEYGSNSSIMNTFNLYSKILRKTFGWRNRFGYIQQIYFNLSSTTLKVHRDKLTKLGIIEWKATKQMTMYKILEPKEHIKTFIFAKKNEDEKIEITLEEKNKEHIETMRELL